MPARMPSTAARSAALGICLLLLASALPPAQAQINVTQVWIDRAEFVLRQAGTPTQFVSSSSGPVHAEIPVRFYGPTQSVNYHIWIANSDKQWVDVPVKCGQVEFTTREEDAPDKKTIAHDFDMPASLADGGYFVMVSINGPTPSGPPADRWPGGCAQTNTLLTQTDDPNGNNVEYYFVEGGRIEPHVIDVLWCAYDPGVAGCAHPGAVLESGTNHPLNQTAPGPGSFLDGTFFRLVVGNSGTWNDTTDHGANETQCFVGSADTCRPLLPYGVRVKVAGALFDESTTLKIVHRAHAPAGSVDYLDTEIFSMVDRGGDYVLNVTLNHDGNLQEHPAEGAVRNNSREETFHVRYVDYAVERSDDWRTNASAPYDHGNGKKVTGTINATQLGSAWRNDSTRLSVWLDGHEFDGDGCVFCTNFTPLDRLVQPDEKWSGAVEWTMSANPADSNYLRPGQHTVNALVWDNGILDANESDDVQRFDIYVQDAGLPVFASTSPVTLRYGHVGARQVQPTGAPRVYEHEPFRLWAIVTDQDQASLNVTANFSSKDNASVWREYALDNVGTTDPSHYTTFVADLTTPDNRTTSNWTVKVTARDAFGNSANHSIANLKVEQWPVQTLAESRIVVAGSTANGTVFHYDDTDEPTYRVELHYNRTGFRNYSQSDYWPPDEDLDESAYAHNLTSNLGLEITYPTVPPTTVTLWGKQQAGWKNLTSCTEVPGQFPDTSTTITCEEETIGIFEVALDKEATGSKPGTWNVSLLLKDVSERTRRINRTVSLVDRIPEFHDTTVSDFDLLPNVDTLNVTANVTDDFGGDHVVATYVNFTDVSAPTGKWINLTLGSPEPYLDPDENVFVNWSLQIPVGRGKTFGEAGQYRVKFLAVDDNGNWNSVDVPTQLQVNDLLNPTLDTRATGVHPAIQEVGQNVSFYAKGDDDTNVTFYATILRPGGDQLARLALEAQLDGNATASFNFTAEGTYPYKIEAIDSAGKVSPQVVEGVLSIRNNLGPRFDVARPAQIHDGRYGQANQRIEMLVYDADGVIEENITLTIDGETVVFDKTPATGGVRGFTLTHTLSGAPKPLHGATVTVNATAVDGSDARLFSWINFTFIVDDLAPTARVEGFQPRHRESDLEPWVVSPETLYSLTASDDDGLPTEVASLRYRIYGPGLASLEEVYGGPFRLTRAFGEDLRPGNYQIQYFAEDTAGNVNRTPQTLTVYVDNTPPSRDPFGAEVEGRYVNVTIVDDHAGVDRAVVWHRVNNGTWGQTSMTSEDGVWRAVLPEARKGDRFVYYVEAWDNVENSATIGDATVPLGTYTVLNHKPTLRVTAPIAGAKITKQRDVTWEAFDADGDALVIEVSLKSPGSQAFTELARLDGPDPRRYAFNSARYSDGDYTLRVRASDGVENAAVDVPFRISNSATAVEGFRANKTSLLPGESTLVTAEVTKASVTSVEARFYRDGALAVSYDLRDDGREGDARANDNLYSARVALADSGDYRVDLHTRYREDGVEKNETYENVARFSVALTPGYVASQYWPVLAMLAVAGAAAIGVAAWAAFRRRR